MKTPNLRSVASTSSPGARAMLVFGGLLSAMCASCAWAGAPKAAAAARPVDAATIEGNWFVVASNSGDFSTGEKADPMITYSPVVMEGGKVHLTAVTTYLEDGKAGSSTRQITQDPKDSSHFVQSAAHDWYLSKVAPDGSWAVLTHGESLGTAPGIEVISRTPSLTSESLAKAEGYITHDPVLRTVGGPLSLVPQKASTTFQVKVALGD